MAIQSPKHLKKVEWKLAVFEYFTVAAANVADARYQTFHILYYSILLRFVVDEEKNKRIVKQIEGLQIHEESSAANKDGKYPCRSPGCQKVFAQDGKCRTAHKAKHNPPVIILEQVKNVILDAEPPLNEQDDMFCYQKALLEYGMLLLNFWDAISEGDGTRILRSWKYFLLYLRNEEVNNKVLPGSIVFDVTS